MVLLHTVKNGGVVSHPMRVPSTSSSPRLTRQLQTIPTMSSRPARRYAAFGTISDARAFRFKIFIFRVLARVYNNITNAVGVYRRTTS